ncbi:MAG: ferrous iron transport protein A [Flavobacteriales bacterium]
MLHTLDHVAIKQEVEIVSVDQSPISSKLTEMGLVSGQMIKTLFKAPFGDPIAIELNGTVLSLRLEEAQFIEVKA